MARGPRGRGSACCLCLAGRLLFFGGLFWPSDALLGGRAPSSASAWDGVLRDAQLGRVRAQARTLAADRHTFSLGSPCNELEATIDQLASQARAGTDTLAPAPLYVEYWARQNWMHLEAHRDCDEFLNGRARERGGRGAVLRYPRSGHVLYLDVGPDVRGPTCVFVDRAARDVPTSPCPTATGAAAAELEPTALRLLPVFSSMEIMPAVSNRLLRFPGECMHGVPRPFDAYLRGGAAAGEEAATTRGFGEEGARMRRQVLLFNVWEGAPPADVHPAGERGAGGGDGGPRCAPLAEWRPVRRVRVRPGFRLWPPAAAEAVPLLVSMLGPAHRRGYRSRVFCARAPPAVRAALREAEAHSVVELDWFANLLVRVALRSSRGADDDP